MYDCIEAARPQRQMSFKQYKKMKLKMLQRDFCIQLEDEELARAEALQSEIQVDQFCLGILNRYWD